MTSRGLCPGHVVRSLTRSKTCVKPYNYSLRRHVQHDLRHRFTTFWIPPRHPNPEQPLKQDVDSNQLLVAAGFLRQAYSGIFHLLPLGLRVQDKLERLIDRHMSSLGASKVSLSSITSQDLWERSGRLAADPDLFKFRGRRDGKWLLAPTHEEEITALVGSLVQFQRDMPVRLYQISRKYRDEPRPRQGLLRGKEFLMKDLYTFDVNSASALSTYEAVKRAYRNLFDELKLPYLVAKADSGNMGGSLSHEFHFPSVKGEDNIISCSHCDYVKNEELVNAIKLKALNIPGQSANSFPTFDGIRPLLREFVALSHDKRHLIKAYVPQITDNSANSVPPRTEVSQYVVKASLPDAKLGYEEPATLWEQQCALLSNSSHHPQDRPTIRYLFDHRVTKEDVERQIGTDHRRYANMFTYEIHVMVPGGPNQELDLVRAASGDKCVQCEEGRLLVQKAIEIGHTFHLGDRYSERLGAKVESNDMTGTTMPMQMGCHGIGVSRLIAAVASALVDERGLNWPRAIAPFQVVIIPQKPGLAEDAAALYDKIMSTCPDVDAIIDDRPKRGLPHKLFEADAIGFPIILVLGKGWEEGKVEIQCRRLGRTKNDPHVLVDDIPTAINALLRQL